MRKLSVICVFFAIVSAIHPQSNEVVDRILASGSLDFGQASYLVLVASDNIPEDSGESGSYEMIKQLGWMGKRSFSRETPVSIADFSWLIMKAFGMKGGVMFTLFPGPRYAYRELKSRDVLQGRIDPDLNMTGRKAFAILARLLEQEDKRK